MLVNPAYIRYLPWTPNTHSAWSLIFHFSHHSFVTWYSISTSLLGSLLKGGSEISGALACTEATFPGGRILSVQGQTEVTGKFWNWRKTWQMRLCVCVFVIWVWGTGSAWLLSKKYHFIAPFIWKYDLVWQHVKLSYSLHNVFLGDGPWNRRPNDQRCFLVKQLWITIQRVKQKLWGCVQGYSLVMSISALSHPNRQTIN